MSKTSESKLTGGVRSIKLATTYLFKEKKKEKNEDNYETNLFVGVVMCFYQFTSCIRQRVGVQIKSQFKYDYLFKFKIEISLDFKLKSTLDSNTILYSNFEFIILLNFKFKSN